MVEIVDNLASHDVYDAWNRIKEVWKDDGDGDLETAGTPPPGQTNVPDPFTSDPFTSRLTITRKEWHDRLVA
ncbi:MAG: hypothetical protein ABFD92_18975 [Planctomycetaceae bacterium]|nr:hypothetical protein [Planctomycetaceae bacterium]